MGPCGVRFSTSFSLLVRTQEHSCLAWLLPSYFIASRVKPGSFLSWEQRLLGLSDQMFNRSCSFLPTHCLTSNA